MADNLANSGNQAAAAARRRLRNAPEARARRRRMVTWALVLGSAVLMVNAFIGENGYLASVRARRDRDAILADITKLRVENQQLIDQARRLSNDPAALEEAARRDLGLIRPGETLIILKDAKTAPANSPATSTPVK